MPTNNQTRLAIVGLSEGNGHPFSFSAIINGYDERGLAASGWPGIYEYVRHRHRSEIGIDGLRVTHAWTQDPDVTHALCAACLIPHAAARFEDLLGEVDAVIIARDDFERHQAMARPFLERGLPVFVDKPLSLDPEELRWFRPYLEQGLLMSCSGVRYAGELDAPRATLREYGRLALVRGAVVLSLEKYGIHMLDAVLNVAPGRPLRVSPHRAPHQSVAIELDDGTLFLLDALGTAPKTFRVDLFGSERTSSHELTDNFTMFRRTLWHFGQMIRTRQPPIPPQHTIDTMRTLMACRLALAEQRTVDLDDIRV